MHTPLFGDYGEVKVKREPVRLTDPDFEIGVTVTKYLFDENMVLEFMVTSTLENTQLVDLRVEVETNLDNLQVQHVERLPCLKNGETRSVRLGLALDPENRVAVTQVECFLRCTMNEYQGNDLVADYEEEYQLEDLEINLGDSLLSRQTSTFEQDWKSLSESGHSEQTTLQLPYKSLE